ncbi:collagen alpha-1(I) chain-like [Diceros bicornis minor]|uniref:collagen alpha-1(I) chain-like n=1 Tax=Diceros bicornis minor TaxID=77932 RepID=UPI0026EC418C|nr:collagen alpha-1(I) chain-like [Diceros bicornis minor]
MAAPGDGAHPRITAAPLGSRARSPGPRHHPIATSPGAPATIWSTPEVRRQRGRGGTRDPRPAGYTLAVSPSRRLSENLAIEIQRDDPDPRGHVSGTGTPSPRPTLEGGGRSALSSGAGLEKHPSESPPTTGPPPRTARAGRSPPPERDSENAVRKVESDDPEPPVPAAEPPRSRPPRASPQGPDDPGRTGNASRARELPPPPRRPRSVPEGRSGTGVCWSTRPGGPAHPAGLEERGDSHPPTLSCTSNLRPADDAPAPQHDRDRSRHCHRPPGTPPRSPRPSHLPCRGRRSSGGQKRYKSGRQVAPDNRRERQRDGSGSLAGRGAQPGRLAARPRPDPPRVPSPGPARPGGIRLGAPSRHGATPAAGEGLGKRVCFGRSPVRGRGTFPQRRQQGRRDCRHRLASRGGPERFPGSREDSGKRGGRGTAKTKPGESSEDDDDRGTTEQLSASRHFQPATASQGRQAKPRGRRGETTATPDRTEVEETRTCLPPRGPRHSPETARGAGERGCKCTSGDQNIDVSGPYRRDKRADPQKVPSHTHTRALARAEEAEAREAAEGDERDTGLGGPRHPRPRTAPAPPSPDSREEEGRDAGGRTGARASGTGGAPPGRRGTEADAAGRRGAHGAATRAEPEEEQRRARKAAHGRLPPVPRAGHGGPPGDGGGAAPAPRGPPTSGRRRWGGGLGAGGGAVSALRGTEGPGRGPAREPPATLPGEATPRGRLIVKRRSDRRGARPWHGTTPEGASGRPARDNETGHREVGRLDDGASGTGPAGTGSDTPQAPGGSRLRRGRGAHADARAARRPPGMPPPGGRRDRGAARRPGPRRRSLGEEKEGRGSPTRSPRARPPRPEADGRDPQGSLNLRAGTR